MQMPANLDALIHLSYSKPPRRNEQFAEYAFRFLKFYFFDLTSVIKMAFEAIDGCPISSRSVRK